MTILAEQDFPTLLIPCPGRGWCNLVKQLVQRVS